MGPVGSKQEVEERRLNAVIHKKNLEDYKEDQKIYKLLLLGTGESGKSTIYKQIRQLYGQKWNDKDLKLMIPRVYENINEQILAVLKARKDFGTTLDNEKLAVELENTLTRETIITEDVASKLFAAWQDRGFQEVYEKRADFQVLECIEYYMIPENIQRIGKDTSAKKYIPSFQDVVQARVKTSGIIKERFRMYGAEFVMYDVGGQRSERKKWLNCFDNVNTVLYLAAISEYDQKLFEDSRTDRVKEAVKVWKDIVNRETFQDIGFILFLNKFDLFKKKVVEFPFKIPGKHGRNQNYVGPDPSDKNLDEQQRAAAIDQCAQFMKNLFVDAIEPRTGYGAISCHFTTAIDTELMDVVFQNCQDQILRSNLVSNGFGYGHFS